MARQKQRLDLFERDTTAVQFTILDGANNPIPIVAGDAFRWGYAAKAGDPVVAIIQNAAFSIFDGPNGIIDMAVVATDVPGPGKFVHELEMTPDGGSPEVVAAGPLILKARILPSV